MRARGLNADFRATGQTGIFIAGSGASIDAIIADFISGCVETLAPENSADHWDLIEGQGSLYNVSYSGVTLGDRKSKRMNSRHYCAFRMPSSAWKKKTQ